jgi:hypothetical protein
MILELDLRTMPQSDCLRKVGIKRKFIVCNSLARKENGHTYPCKQCKAQDRLRVSTPTKQNTSGEPTGRVSEELAPDQHYRTSEEGQTPATATARDPKSLQTSRCRVNWVHSRSGFDLERWSSYRSRDRGRPRAT